MRTKLSFLALAILILLAFSPVPSTKAQIKQPNETARIHLTSKPAIVRIISGYIGRWEWQNRTYDTQNLSSGSGFIINPAGYILTNAHVVSDIKEGDDAGKNGLFVSLIQDLLRARGIAITNQSIQQGAQYLNQTGARLISFQRINYVFLQSGNRFPYEIKSYGAPSGEGKDLPGGKDVSVIKIEVKNAPTVPLGNSDEAQVGDQVWVIGYPGAADSGLLDAKSQLEPTTNDGKISAKKTSADGAPILQTNTSTTHGNSGGPAINDKGEVIGLLTFRGNVVNGQEVQGFNFIVPINTAMEFVKQAGTENKRSQVDLKWKEGLEYYWQQQYSFAQRDFSEVVTLFPDHSEAAKLIQESQEHIVKGEDQSGTAILGAGLIVIVVVVVILLVVVGGIILIVVVVSRKKKSAGKAPAPQARPAQVAPSQSFSPQQQPQQWQQQQATHPVGGGTTPGFQPTVRLNAQQATEVIGNSPRLICTAGPALGQEFPVGQGVYIGRDGTRSQIVVSDPQVSGQHLWIGMINGRFVARDNGSTNGTFLNGQTNQRITEVELKDNDVLTLGGQGSVKFAFQR